MARVLLIAEIGINHGGSLSRAKEMCVKAKEAGADIAKFQHYRASIILGTSHPAYKEAKKAQFNLSEHGELKSFCDQIGIEYCCSLFHANDVSTFLEMGVKRFKVASRSVIDTNLLSEINKTKKPVIISNGTAKKYHLDRAVTWTEDCPQTLLSCVSEYPTPLEKMWVPDMLRLKDVYSVSVGLSSHCPNISPSVYAAAHGASVIEHHVCDTRTEPGVDIPSSLTFEEFRQMAKIIRDAEEMRGY